MSEREKPVISLQTDQSVLPSNDDLTYEQAFGMLMVELEKGMNSAKTEADWRSIDEVEDSLGIHR